MASIQTGIELNDQFTSVIYGIINAVNLTVSAMEDMQQTIGTDIDTSSLEGMRNEINQATIALNELSDAMQNQSSLNTGPPSPVQQNAPPSPVEVPVQWNTDSFEVFTGNGMERFQQEVQSANTMLNQLSSTQNEIARQAYSTNLLPPDASADLTRLATRIDAVRNRIEQIENNPVNFGTDEANAELEQLRGQLNQAIQEQNALNQAMQNMDASAANDAYLRLSKTVSTTERYIRDNVDEQGRFNQEIQNGTNDANGLTNAIKGAAAAYVSIQAIGNILNTSDELVQTTSRLNMMNDGLQSTQELTNMVYAAAQDARGSFSEMTAVVARFGNNAKDAFSSSEEVVAFSTLVQKQMTIAGASTQEASNAMLQLSQALGSGVLRGDELNSIFEQAPNLIQNIADYLGVGIGEIREMASEGELTADVVKAAIFAASDDINSKFESMPMTWAQVFQSMRNTALIAFQPVLQILNHMANSELFQSFVNGAIEGMAILANIVLNIFGLMASGAGVIADNWSVISPIVYGIVAALAVYAGYLAVTKGIELASTAVKIAMCVASYAHAAATRAEASADVAATAAQYGLNTALLSSPITWIIILIIALIAALVALCNWIAETTDTANSGIGIISGALAVVLAFIANLVLGIINFVIGLGVTLWNFIAAFVNYLGNVFNDPVGSIAWLFFDLVDTVLSLLQSMASAIDTIFGSNLAGSVQGWRDSLEGWVDDTYGQGTEIMAKASVEDLELDRFEYGDAWDKGIAFGDGIAKKINDFSLSDLFGKVEIPDPEDYSFDYDDFAAASVDMAGVESDLGDIAGDTGNISDSLDITNEDLKYLRDIAEQETVNRFTTAAITIKQTNHNTISSEMDIDGVVTALTDAVDEAVEIMTEGEHE